MNGLSSPQPIKKTEEDYEANFNKHFGVLNKKVERFLSNTTTPDVLIIKTHLLCEYYINQLLVLKLPDGVKLTEEDFRNKIDKVFNPNDTGYKKERGLLTTLNKIRNRVGHEIEYSLSESDVDSIGHYFGKRYIVDKYEEEKNGDYLLKILKRYLILIVADLSWEVMKETMSAKKELGE